LAALAAAQARTEASLARLSDTQAQTEASLGRLSEALAHMETQLERLTAAQVGTAARLDGLMNWQRGEDGRRKGERYERSIVRRALSLFAGGEGGSTERESVQQRLGLLLEPIVHDLDFLMREHDTPFLADLIWWKGDRLVVAEVSSVVDEYDVLRAQARTAALRRAGADVLPVVIGEAWDGDHPQKLAQERGVAWKVGDDLSESFIAYRRLQPTDG
jgi:hypothetical protein